MNKIIIAAAVIAGLGAFAEAAPRRTVNREAKLHKFSTTIEKERPQLNEETKRLIAVWRRNPSQQNWDALKKQVEINYDKIVERKKAKLEDLKRTARDRSKVDEMRQIVDEMLRDRENRVAQTMLRFTDPRLRPGVRTRNQDGYLPVIGAGRDVWIAYTPVTNEDYARFVEATRRKPPKGWTDGRMPAGKAKHPVTNVSLADAEAYCRWLTGNDGTAVYRLPTEAEWETAAGHMPKDADFNCGERHGTSPVDAYEKTLSACGAVDMWGNCWEWTATALDSRRGAKMNAVKGGAWDSRRTECRTELRGIGKDPASGYDNVGFRVIRVK